MRTNLFLLAHSNRNLDIAFQSIVFYTDFFFYFASTKFNPSLAFIFIIEKNCNERFEIFVT